MSVLTELTGFQEQILNSKKFQIPKCLNHPPQIKQDEFSSLKHLSIIQDNTSDALLLEAQIYSSS